jgi:hypothetical protein
MHQPNEILAIWGQIAAIILVIELFLLIVIAVALNAALAFAFAWVREKVELVKKLRPVVDSVNTTTEAAIKGTLPEARTDENKIVRTVAQIPAQANAIEGKVVQGTDRVANAVIEFRARTVMVEGIVKAFFLPGLMRPKPRFPEIESPEPKLLLEGRSEEVKRPGEPADGRADLVAPEGRLEPAGASRAQARDTFLG